jgi:hypothetical protein
LSAVLPSETTTTAGGDAALVFSREVAIAGALPNAATIASAATDVQNFETRMPLTPVRMGLTML